MSVRKGSSIIAGLSSFDIIDFQEPSSSNNYRWYKKYRNGWVEQGGKTTISMTATGTSVQWSGTFLVTMANTDYTFSVEEKSGWIYTVSGGVEGTGKTALSGWYQVSGGDVPRDLVISWQVFGMAES